MQISILIGEVLQSWRALLRNPRYLIIAGLTLALGIAATASVFSLLYQALLKPLPFPNHDRLVTIGMDPGDGSHLAAPALYRLMEGLQEVESIAIASAYTRKVSVATRSTPIVGNVMLVDRGFVKTLGLPMAHGRNFNVDEDRPKGERAVMLSHAFWRSHYGGDARIVGDTVQIEGRPFRVVGVLAQDLVWPMKFDVLVPMRVPKESQDLDTNQFIIARLRAEASIPTLSPQIDTRTHALIDQLRTQIPPEGYDFLKSLKYDARSLSYLYSAGTGSTLWLFFAASLCVLLIAAVNLTNLAMLRAIVRSHDSAVRNALGATRLRLAIAPLGESLLISMVGSVFGLTLAWFGLRIFGIVAPQDWTNGNTFDLDPMAFAFAFGLGLLTSLLSVGFGVLRGSRREIVPELVSGGRSGISRESSMFGRILVVVQVAFATALLIVAALFMRDLHTINSVPLGFAPDGITTFTLAPIPAEFPDITAVDRQVRDILNNLDANPDIVSATVGSNLPAGSQLNYPATLPDDSTIQPQLRVVDSSYHSFFSIKIVSGRGIKTTDDRSSEAICLVSESFVREHLDGDGLGQMIRLGRGGDAASAMRIVGVVSDVRHAGPNADTAPTVYVPLAQASDALWSMVREYSPLHYAVSMREQSNDIEPALRRAVYDVSPNQPIADIQSMYAVLETTLGNSRLQLLLVGIFAISAALLAGVGLYSVLSVTVAARTHEYGVRLALGATPRDLIRLVLRDSGLQLGLGMALGAMLALLFSRSIAEYLHGVNALDPIAYVAVFLVLSVAGLLSSLAPASRCARTSPMRALRVD